MAEVAVTKKKRRQRKQVHPLQNQMSFDRDVVECWRSIGKSEDLSTDTGIAKFLISLYTQRAACTKDEDGVQSCVKCVICHRPLTLYCLTCKLSASQIPTPQSPPLQEALRTSVRCKRQAPLPSEKDSSRAFSLSQAPCVTSSSQHVPSMQVFPSEETGKSDRFHAEFRHEPVPGVCMGTGLVEKSPDPVTEEIGNDGPLSDIKGVDDDVESEPFAGAADPDGSDCCVTKLEGTDSISRTAAADQKLVVAGSLVQASSICSNVSTVKHAEPAWNVEGEEQEHASSLPQQPQAKKWKRGRPRGAEYPSRSKRKCQGKGESSSTDANQSSASAVTFPDDACGSVIEEGPLLKCRHCSYSSKRRWNLSRHLRRRHSPEKSKLAAEASAEEGRPQSSQMCDQCGRTFVSRFGFSVHMRSKHLLTFKHVCQVCGKGFNVKSHYTTHVTSHVAKGRYACPVCGDLFRKRVLFRRHMRVEHAERCQVRCSVEGCSKTFSSVACMKSHVQGVHKQRRTTLCHLCGRAFKWRSSLLYHRRKDCKTRPIRRLTTTENSPQGHGVSGACEQTAA